MTRDAHAEEHANWDHEYRAGSYVLLDGREICEETVEPDEPYPYPTYRHTRYSNVHGHTQRARETDR